MLELTAVSCPGRLQNITVSLPAGRLVALIGANGSGKSSLLLALACLLPSQGQITLAGVSLLEQEMSTLAQWRAMLPQRQATLLPLSCLEVLRLGVSMLAAPPAAAELALQTLIERLELGALLARDFSQLSGGEQQRVLIAKTLLQVWPSCNPHGRLLLLDEPLAGLDWHHQVGLLALLKELVAQGLLVLLSIHDFNLAAWYADELLCLEGGKLVAQGAVSILNSALIARLFKVQTECIEQGGRPVYVPRL